VRRDLDLIRKLVLAVEDREPGEWLPQIEIDGYTPQQIGYHSYLVVDAGLARGTDLSTVKDMLPNWQLSHLTSAGHDFADAARNDSTWNQATRLVKDKGAGFTLDVVKQVLVSVVKNTLGL
jgi:hypothetical protein